MEKLFREYKNFELSDTNVFGPENSLYCNSSMSTYKMIMGDLPPDPQNQVLRMYFAYKGDVVKYAQVKTTDIDYDDVSCIVHGIYFHLNFAYWCKENMLTVDNRIQVAVSAKLIMNNDLTYVHNNVYCIWYPDQPSEETCIKLLKDYSHLKYQVARVCVEYNYNELFKTLDILPEEGLLGIAESKPNRELRRYIKHQRKQHKQKLWRILNDTDAMLTEPRLVKARNMFECDVLPIEALKSMYCDEDKEIKVYVTDPILDLDRFITNSLYYDPLQTGTLSFDIIKQKMRQLLS